MGLTFEKAYVNRLLSRSSNIADFYTAFDHFVERLRSDNVFEVIVEKLINETSFVAISGQSRTKQLKRKTLWCVVPYHPVILEGRVIAKALACFRRPPWSTLFEAAFNDAQHVPHVAASWSLSSIPFGCSHIRL